MIVISFQQFIQWTSATGWIKLILSVTYLYLLNVIVNIEWLCTEIKPLLHNSRRDEFIAPCVNICLECHNLSHVSGNYHHFHWHDSQIIRHGEIKGTVCHATLMWNEKLKENDSFNWCPYFSSVVEGVWVGLCRGMSPSVELIVTQSACLSNIQHGTRALSQYKDRLIYVWRFPC